MTDKQKVTKLQKQMAEESIALPSSPFVDVLKTFGRDELIALFINVAATAAAARVVSNNLFLSISGPVVEKIGFFVAYLKDAWDVYRTTPDYGRKSLLFYVSKALKQGGVSMTKDILFHDPIYTAFLFTGLLIYRGTPAWMLSLISFVLAVCCVALGEVAVNEIRYWLHVWKLKRAGFRRETYWESRFVVDDKTANKILDDLAETFNLSVKAKIQYHDRYFETNIEGYNARTPKFRLRQRNKESGGHLQTVQVIHTRASQVARMKPTQFNYFPTRKEKLWKELPQKMPWTIAEIEEGKTRRLCEKVTFEKQFHDVYFERKVARDPQTILVSIDRVASNGQNEAFTVVEIKAHTDKRSQVLLIEAMRYLMLHFPVIQTTHTKSFLANLNLKP